MIFCVKLECGAVISAAFFIEIDLHLQIDMCGGLRVGLVGCVAVAGIVDNDSSGVDGINRFSKEKAARLLHLPAQ